MPRKSRHTIHASYESSMSTFMLTLERPSAEQLVGHDRSQKYALLKQSASNIREQLVAWIDENGLSEDVARVGEPTVFNTLFVTSTHQAAQKLIKAPGVLKVAPGGDVPVDLLVQEKDEAAEMQGGAPPSRTE